QFHAVVQLLYRQRLQIGSYWSSSQAVARGFSRGTTVIGQVSGAQAAMLEDDGQPVTTVVPREGMTGWVASWMMTATARHPDCMLKWLAYSATPIVQATVAPQVAASPANPEACAIIDRRLRGYCTDHHSADAQYFDS